MTLLFNPWATSSKSIAACNTRIHTLKWVFLWLIIPSHCLSTAWQAWCWHPLQAGPARSLSTLPPTPEQSWFGLKQNVNYRAQWALLIPRLTRITSRQQGTSSSMMVALPRLLRALVIFLPKSASTILLADQNSAISFKFMINKSFKSWSQHYEKTTNVQF